MFIHRDADGKPVEYTGSFNKSEWDEAVAEYAKKEEATASSERPRTRKAAATKED